MVFRFGKNAEMDQDEFYFFKKKYQKSKYL